MSISPTLVPNNLLRGIRRQTRIDVEEAKNRPRKESYEETPNVEVPVMPTRSTYDPLSMYLQSIGKIPLITPQEEIELANRIKDGDEKARNKMIEANLRLVVAIARKFTWSCLPFIDLISEGNIGLMTAVDRFDPTKKVKFSTYGSWWIRQGILKAIYNKARMIRLPINIQENIYRLHRAEASLLYAYGELPTSKELSTDLGISVSRVEYLRKANETHFQLDAKIDDQGDSTFAELIPDTSIEDPTHECALKSEFDWISKFFAYLSKREQSIINFRFGLNGENPMTLDEVGKRFEISRERVRQILSIIVNKLRKRIKTHAFQKNPSFK